MFKLKYEDTDEFAALISLIYYVQGVGAAALGLTPSESADVSVAWCEITENGEFLPDHLVEVADISTRDEVVEEFRRCFAALLQAAPTLQDSLRVSRTQEFVRMLATAA